MLYVHDQCISLKILNCSAILDSGFLSKATISNEGITPRTENKITPGIKKLLKGIFLNSDKGNPNSSPSGEIISIIPPPIAPNERKPNKIKKIFRVIFFCKTVYIRLVAPACRRQVV